MLHKKLIGIALIASAAVSTTAFADNRGVNTALGAVVGAVIGNSIGGQDAAIVGGVPVSYTHLTLPTNREV